MVVDHAGGLHEGVDDGGADKLEAPFFQGLAHGVGHRGGGGHLLECAEVIDLRLPLHKVPEKVTQGAALFAQRQIGAGIANGGSHFQPIADDARILKQGGHLAVVIAGNLLRVEAIEDLAIMLALAQYGNPAQPGLGTFQIQAFKQGLIIILRHSPLVIVVVLIERVIPAPGTAVVHHFSLLWFHSQKTLRNPPGSGRGAPGSCLPGSAG